MTRRMLRRAPLTKRIEMLELFSGTRSLSKPFEKRGHEVVSVELDEQFEATIHADILDLEPSDLGRPGQFLFIWASPPCTAFSVASLTHHWRTESVCKTCDTPIFRKDAKSWAHVSENGCKKVISQKSKVIHIPETEKAEHGLAMLRHTLYLIEELNPRWWIIENPRAMMRRAPELQGVERRTITHCQYGDPRRMKPTDLFGVFPEGFEARACQNGDPCHTSAPRGARTGTQALSTLEAGMLPPELGVELCAAIEAEL